MQYGAATDYRVAYGYDGLLRLNSVTGSTAPAFTYTYAANANLVARVAQLSGCCRDTTYELASNRVSDLNHTWGPAADLLVAASYQYNNAGLRSVEKTDGINLMALLQRSSGLYSDFTYTDRREVDTAGQYDLTATWAKGAAVAGTARDYNYDPIGNRTADQSGSYTPNALNQYSAAPGVAALTYDLAGNLTADGTRTYTYDAENRLASVTRAGTTTTFKYDYLGRRIAKKVGTNAEIRFVYDCWNLIAEIDSSTFAILRSYTWGLDASGGLQAAGGVGGLLAVSLSNGSTYYPIYDGSYNIIGLYDGTGALAAAYRYDPFGNVLQSAGTAALVNPFGFSTKFTDRDTSTEGGLVYYGLRYYHPRLGRFINRDPIEEQGGINLYAFCGNDGVNRWDYLGMNNIVEEGIQKTQQNQADAAAKMSGGQRADGGTPVTGTEDVFDKIRRTGGTGDADGRTYARDNPLSGTIYGRSWDSTPRFVLEYYEKEASELTVAIATHVREKTKQIQPAPGRVVMQPITLNGVEIGRVYIRIAAPNSEAVQLSDFAFNGSRTPSLTQADANRNLESAFNTAVSEVNRRLTGKMLSLNPVVREAASSAWLRFNSAMAKYSGRITVNEIPGAPGQGGANRSGSRGVLNWDPAYTHTDIKGLVSDPIVIFGHEMTHVFDGIENSPVLKDFCNNTDAGPLTNLTEVSAISFENLLRTGPPRTYHNPSKSW